MTERYTVRICKDDLVFSAGHFITFNGAECERLHGHNYRVSMEVEAPLDGNYYVLDFIAFRKHALELLSTIDHRMLVPTKNPLLPVTIDEEVTIRFGPKRWVFPKEDCAVLDIENTTVELLAKWIGDRMLGILHAHHHFHPTRIRVEVEENFGQWASRSLEWSASALPFKEPSITVTR